MTEQDSFAIKIIRITATFMIFLCHTVFLFGDTVAFTAQFFNIGVDVFLFITAYLFSVRKNTIKNILLWYKKRLLRICVPYYWLIFAVCVACLFFSVKLNVADVAGSVLFLQGFTENYLPGGGHLWYLTAIMISYLITPLLYKLKYSKFIFKFVFFICGIVIYVLLVMFLKPIFATVFFKVFEYSLYFIVIPVLYDYFEKKKEIRIVIISVLLLITFCILKILFNILFDDTSLYNNFLVPITSLLIGASIYYFLFYLFKISYSFLEKKQLFIKAIKYFDNISFEFYLVHYFFITFPINFVLDINPILNFALILFTSYFTANVFHFISRKTYKVIDIWEQKH